MVQLLINEERCRKDGICSMVCPTHFIKGTVGTIPEQRKSPNAFCLQCGQCIAFCPHDAVEISTLEELPKPKIDRKLIPSPESMEQLVYARRSIRQYKDKPVPKELLTELLRVAGNAPTAKNSRALRFIIVYDKEQMQALGDCMADCLEGKNGEAQGASESSAEKRALVRAWRGGIDVLHRGAPHLIAAVAPADWYWNREDGVIALSYLELLAPVHGLGTCWAGYVTAAARQYSSVREFLGIKEDEIICGGQLLGIPRFLPKTAAPRRPYSIDWK